jgi:hypothetical protein
MPKSPNYDVQYDHGTGIYPVDDGVNQSGFCDLPKVSCNFLNDYFTKLGYSREELGLHE